ncbi:hypothetical protein SAMN04487934_103170 [Eubacterium ruminantium]|nr:hypothetical protein SAMN04487934_103170 [Eubacterium ruminantium]
MRKDKKKSSKKIAAAFSMFALSAAMLGTATYAWFTMSREVELTGIQMTATVPSDLQIALGEIADGSEANSLAKSTSYLVSSNNVVAAPADQVDDDPFDWSNTADISKYYQFGKLIPASSIDGENVYYTADATGVGKTYSSGAVAVQATSSGATTAHVNTSTSDGWSSGTYVAAASYTDTQDDGFYVDIPVWLRTSNKTATDVYVTGFISDNGNPSSLGSGSDGDDLYKAVRVAILDAGGAENGGIVELNDGTSYPTAKIAAADSLIDSGIANANWSLTDKNALSSDGTMAAGSYGSVVVNDGSVAIASLAARTTAQYGAATKIIVRVWLEGEDANCWNANAGQDWKISLQFMTSALQ